MIVVERYFGRDQGTMRGRIYFLFRVLFICFPRLLPHFFSSPRIITRPPPFLTTHQKQKDPDAIFIHFFNWNWALADFIAGLTRRRGWCRAAQLSSHPLPCLVFLLLFFSPSSASSILLFFLLRCKRARLSLSILIHTPTP
jgi:hypothetical protein